VARKKITAKKSRKDDLDPSKDEFIEKSMTILDWAVERRKQIGVLLLVALVAAIAGIAFSNYRQAKAADSSALLDEGLAALVAPVITVPEGEEVPPKEEMLYFESEEAKANEILRAFEKADEEGKGTFAGKAAILAEAGASLELGKTDDAIAKYEEFLSGIDEDVSWLEPNAREGLGHAYEAAGKLDEAAETFAEMAEKSEGRIALMARYNEARVAEKKGERNKAGELLSGILDELREEGDLNRLDFLFLQARERMLHINPQADVPSIPGGGMNGFDPQLLQQLIQAQQASGGAAN